jgi:hypothetical protein
MSDVTYQILPRVYKCSHRILFLCIQVVACVYFVYCTHSMSRSIMMYTTMSWLRIASDVTYQIKPQVYYCGHRILPLCIQYVACVYCVYCTRQPNHSIPTYTNVVVEECVWCNMPDHSICVYSKSYSAYTYALVVYHSMHSPLLWVEACISPRAYCIHASKALYCTEHVSSLQQYTYWDASIWCYTSDDISCILHSAYAYTDCITVKHVMPHWCGQGVVYLTVDWYLYTPLTCYTHAVICTLCTVNTCGITQERGMSVSYTILQSCLQSVVYKSE